MYSSEKHLSWKSPRNELHYYFKTKEDFQRQRWRSVVFKWILLLALLALIIWIWIYSYEQVTSPQETNDRDLLTKTPSKFQWMTNYIPQQMRAPQPDSSQTKNFVIIYWNQVFDKPVMVGNTTKWPYFHLGDNCPVPCTLTTDHSRKEEAAAIVVHARNIEEMPPQDRHNNTNTVWILHSNESPRFTPVLNSARLMSKFNFYVSYRLDSDFPLSLFHKPSLESPPVPFQSKRQVPAVALYSNCEAVRTGYLAKLMHYIAIDSYGKCLNNAKLPQNIAPRGSPNFAKSLVKLYKNYKFTIVFMNSDCDYYADEKLYYALSAGSVPIFMGTDKIDEFLPGNLRNAIIRVRDFATPELLGAFVKYLANKESAYNTYLRWKVDGYSFPEDYSRSALGQLWDGLPTFCRLCAELHSGNKGRNGLPVENCRRRSIRHWIRSGREDK